MSTDDIHMRDINGCSSSQQPPHTQVKDETHNSARLEPHSAIKCRWTMCGGWFSSLNDLANHVSHTHAVAACEGLFYCGWEGCSRPHKGFNARYKMLVHVRTHTNEKPHQCPECNKSFSRAENLKIHARSHTGEKPYTCPVPGCHKAYSNSSDRFKHTRTHSIEKPYVCKVPGCNKRYTDPSSLRKHAKTYSHFVTTRTAVIDIQQKTQSNYNSEINMDSNILRKPQPHCVMVEHFNPDIEFTSGVNYRNTLNYNKEIQNEEKNQMITEEEEERELQLECVTTVGKCSASWLQSLYPHSVLSWSKLEEQDAPLDLTVHPSSYH